jgi:hypothetical protein
MAVIGMAEKKPAAEICAMERDPSGADTVLVARTIDLPRS